MSKKGTKLERALTNYTKHRRNKRQPIGVSPKKAAKNFAGVIAIVSRRKPEHKKD
jgi:hypothetical protein